MFPRGLVIGLTVAAPIGPMAALVIKRTVAHGRRLGLATGLGVAVADGIYGAFAAFGLTSLTALLLDLQMPLRMIGGLFLVYLGVTTFRSRPGEVRALEETPSLVSAFSSTIALTLANPPTILVFGAIFAGAGYLPETAAWNDAMLLVLGVVTGSLGWWFMLVSITSAVRGRLGPRHLVWVNRASGTVLLAFGLVALATVFS